MWYPDEWQHGRMVQKNSLSKARLSSVTHSQHFFLERTMSDALVEHDENFTLCAEILPVCGLPMT